jgi:phage N-6-adenine-methyltransferase
MSYVTHYAGARKQDWTTPRAMLDTLNAEYGFTLDGASDDGNALLPRSNTAADVLVSWVGERVFCNPPWSSIREFVERAAFADLAVLLVPARVNARWFHRALALGATVRFFEGRPRFGDGKGSSPVDCLLLVFDPPPA